jgi:bla regulator protein blaR1
VNELNSFLALTGKCAMWLTAWSWQTLMLLACVWLGLKIARVKSPALRHQVWLIGLIAVTLLPLLAAGIEWLPLPRLQQNAIQYIAAIPEAIIVTTPADIPVLTTDASPRAPGKLIIARSVLFLTWLGGVLVFLIQLWQQRRSLRRLRMSAEQVSPANLGCEKYENRLSALRTQLAFSPEVRSPTLLGVLKPLIVLPANLTDWTDASERCAMIEHELAHVERRDHYGNLFQRLIEVVFFFHPLVRYACRQLGLERELACDDRVVGLGVNAEIYAESILKVSERGITQSWAPGGAYQLALFSTKQMLERRIEMILNTDRARALNTQWRYLVLHVVLLAVVSLLLLPGRPVNASLTPATQDGKVRKQVMSRIQSPDPWKLVVKVPEGDGSYKLNDMELSSLEDLEQKLTQALAGRPEDKKVVFVLALKTKGGLKADKVKVDNKVIAAIKKAGGKPNIVIKTVTTTQGSHR